MTSISSPRSAVAGRTLSPGIAYALVAAVVGLALFASATPSPLYEVYARLWGLSPIVLTLVYATYAFGVLLILFAVAFTGALRLPEPVGRRSALRLTPQRPSVPRSVRRPFLLAALAVTSSWSIGGLFLALGPELSGRLFDTTNHLVTGVDVFLLAGAGSVAQLAFGRRAPWAGAAGGSVALAAGMALVVVAASTDSAALLVTGALVGGAGFGVAFLGALRVLSGAIPPDQRGAVMSAFYVVAYTALSIPAVLAGIAGTSPGLRATFELFGGVVGVLALVVAAEAWRTRPPARERHAVAPPTRRHRAPRRRSGEGRPCPESA